MKQKMGGDIFSSIGRVNSSQIDQALIPGCICIFRSLESFKHFQVLSSIIVLLHTKHNKPGWWQRNNNVVPLSSLEMNHPLQQTQIDFMPFGQPDSVLSRRANGQSLSHLGPIHNPLCLFMDKQANGLLWSIILFCRKGHKGPENLTNTSKVIEQVRGDASSRIKVFQFTGQNSYP